MRLGGPWLELAALAVPAAAALGVAILACSTDGLAVHTRNLTWRLWADAQALVELALFGAPVRSPWPSSP